MNKPNILIFMTDQQRGDSIPPYSKAMTPNINKFCEEGITFSQAFCPSPHCCPSRASFFSGLYPSEHGVWNNVDTSNSLSKGLNEDVRLWSEDLKDAGYDLFYSGKWHVDHYDTPWDRGWEMKKPKREVNLKEKEKNSRKISSESWEKYKKLACEPEPSMRNEAEILRPGYGTYIHYGEKENPKNDLNVVEEAIEKLRERNALNEPWCQFVGPLGPHDPYFVPQKYLDMYPIENIELPPNFKDTMKDKPNLYRRTRKLFDQLTELEHRQAIRHYLAFCTYEDALFGKVLDALDEIGQKDNTLVLYISDHGDYAGEHGLWCKGLPCFRSAYHIPAAARWPKGITEPGRVINEFVSLTDFAPTFLEATGIKIDRRFSGNSLIPFFQGERPKEWTDAVYTQSNGNELYGIQRSVTTSDWKYVYNGFDNDELYDLKADPYEMYNVIAFEENQKIVKSMVGRMWKFAYEHGDNCINAYIMVGLVPYGPAEAFIDQVD